MGNLKKHGKATDVVSPGGTVIIQKGELYRLSNWNGIAMSTVLPTDPELGFALEVSEDFWYVQAPSGLVAHKGDALYWAGNPTVSGIWQGAYDLVVEGSSGALANPAVKVEETIDSNYIVGVRVLNVGF